LYIELFKRQVFTDHILFVLLKHLGAIFHFTDEYAGGAAVHHYLLDSKVLLMEQLKLTI